MVLEIWLNIQHVPWEYMVKMYPVIQLHYEKGEYHQSYRLLSARKKQKSLKSFPWLKVAEEGALSLLASFPAQAEI